MSRRFLTADWRYLLMLNYEVDPELLRSRIPAGVELDFWHGRTYISMVGFRFLHTRVLGLAIPFHINFDEINLRFYVRRKAADGWRRGVAFIKEVVPRWAIAATARWFYNEAYVACPMKSHLHLPAEGQPGSVEYTWKSRSQWNSLSAQIAGTPAFAVAGSEEEFITEHYWGYVSQKDKTTVEYEVVHPRWRVWPATEARFHCAISEFYGPAFVEPLSKTPTSAFVAEGSAIEVRQGEKLREGA